MKVLKGFGLGLVAFWLFIALIILGPACNINSTALNPEFAKTEIEKLNISSTVQQILQETLPSEAAPYFPAINATINENRLWINSQMEYSINKFYDYVLGKSGSLDLVISTEQIKQSLSENLRQTYAQLPPSEQGLPFEELQRQIIDEIPSVITLNQDNIPSDIWQTLQKIKDISGYIRIAYIGLIGFSLAMIALIILITRARISATLFLGIIFLVSGGVSLSAAIVTQQLVPDFIPMIDLPSQIQVWVKQLLIDLFSPWIIYGIVVLVIGIFLLVTSILFYSRRKQKSITV
jgi:hypothetical protein